MCVVNDGDHGFRWGHRGTPIARWFIVENPFKMDDLGVPRFQETPICFDTLRCYDWRFYRNAEIGICHCNCCVVCCSIKVSFAIYAMFDCLPFVVMKVARWDVVLRDASENIVDMPMPQSS